MLSAILAVGIIRVFIADTFKIKGSSMSPALVEGEHVVVNKFLFGARIYKRFNFTSSELSSFRTRGMRSIYPNDIVVFNCPEGVQKGHIGFKINYVLVKRCIGCPGDTISIVDGWYHNSTYDGLTLGSAGQQLKLQAYPDSLLSDGSRTVISTGDSSREWTIKDFGPYYIPRKGDLITLNKESAFLYRRMIEFESGKTVRTRNENVYLNGVLTNEYRFSNNYYFFGGDNVLNSRDSRHFGLVPESFIIGITRSKFSISPFYCGRIDSEK